MYFSALCSPHGLILEEFPIQQCLFRMTNYYKYNIKVYNSIIYEYYCY